MNIFHRISLKIMNKNKIRTLVTILGVILATATITGLATLVFSIQQSLVQTAIKRQGNWHIHATGMPITDMAALMEDERVSKVLPYDIDGYAYLGEGLIHRDMLYGTQIVAATDDFFQNMPIQILRGRFPQNKNEILLTERMLSNTFSYQVGDKIKLDLVEEEVLDNIISSHDAEYAESLSGREREYNVVGICKTEVLDKFGREVAPFFTYLDKSREDGYSPNAFIRFKNVRKVYDFPKPDHAEFEYNKDLLLYMGSRAEPAFSLMLYSLGGVLMVIVVIGAVLLIYSAFSISVSERTQQFGLLSSVGATPKQLFRTVHFEAAVIAVLGIPAGIASGIAGMGLTLLALKNALRIITDSDTLFVMKMHISPLIILTAGLIALCTVFISAHIPAIRAAKYTAMDSIRQSGDIFIPKRKIRGSKWFYMCFGLEGMLADKQFKRNKKRYRTTILSLVVSIVLFLSASAFNQYLLEPIGNIMADSTFDVQYMPESKNAVEEMRQVYPALNALKEVEQSSYLFYDLMQVSASVLDEKYLELTTDYANGDTLRYAAVILLDDKSYKAYAEQISMEQNIPLPRTVCINLFRNVDAKGKYYFSSFLKDENLQNITLTSDQGEKANIPLETLSKSVPMGVSSFYGDYLCIISSETEGRKWFDSVEQWRPLAAFKLENTEKVPEVSIKMQEILIEHGLGITDLYELTDEEVRNRNLMLCVNVATGGFIILVALIAVANVFNTISTNIQLRRKEFAMLKSIGMNDGSFFKMICLECGIYGAKSLLWGLPIAALAVYGIHVALNQGVGTDYMFPWFGTVICAVSVFGIVFLSMMYAARKIKKESIIETLKNDNI